MKRPPLQVPESADEARSLVDKNGAARVRQWLGAAPAAIHALRVITDRSSIVRRHHEVQ